MPLPLWYRGEEKEKEVKQARANEGDGRVYQHLLTHIEEKEEGEEGDVLRTGSKVDLREHHLPCCPASSGST